MAILAGDCSECIYDVVVKKVRMGNIKPSTTSNCGPNFFKDSDQCFSLSTVLSTTTIM